MEEEISLRELIEVLLNGKWLIAGITAVAMLISGVVSVFVIDPTYEAKATVMINKLDQANGSLEGYLNEMVSPQIYEQQLKSPELLRRVIEQEGLDPEKWSVSGFQNKIKIEPVKDTRLITVSMEGTDPEKTASIINTLVRESKKLISEGIDEQLQVLMTQYENQMAEEQEKLDAAIAEYNRLKAGAGLPTLILFQHTASGSQYMLEANQALLEELRNLEKEKQVEFTKINTKINKLTGLYNTYYAKYEEARSISSLSFVDNQVSLLSEAFPPKNPVGPNTKLNVAIALVVGLMAGVFIVFFRSYWKNTKTATTNTSINA